MIAPDDLNALRLTLQLASASTLLLLLFGTPLAWGLATKQWRGKVLIETIVALPLVLPPTVLGFYLLLAFAPQSPLGRMLESFGIAPLAFSFSGLVLGSAIYSLPFVVQPLQNAFAAIGSRPFEVAATLGLNRRQRFMRIALPLAKPGFITASTLGFAHTLGEFGVVLMIGGNIPDQTRVASIAIYEHVETVNYPQAHGLSMLLLLLSFALLSFIYRRQRSAVL